MERLWNRSYISILIANTCSWFSFFMITTMLVSYLTSDEMGISIAVAGTLAGLIAITSLFFRPFSGYISDRVNMLKLLRIASLLMAIGIIGYLLFSEVIMIGTFRVIHGIGFALNSTAVIAFSINFISKDKIGEGIGYFSMGGVVCEAAAPGVGIWIADTFGIKVVFIVAAVSCLFGFLIYSFNDFNYQKKVTESKKFSWDDVISPNVFGYTFVSSIFSMSNGIVATYILIYAKSLGIANISLFFLTNAVVMVILRPFAGKLFDRKGLSVVALPGILMISISMFLLAYASNAGEYAMHIIILSAVFRAAGKGCAQPSLQAAAVLKAGEGRSGVATSTFYLGGDVGQGTGPTLAGILIAGFASVSEGAIFIFRGLGFLFILDFFILLIIQRRENLKKEVV